MVIRIGDVWRIDGSTWEVVGQQQNELWPLSGPGPCRGLRYLDTHNILAGELIERTAAVQGAEPNGD